ncbi:phage protein [Furfurilactobacillus rossiae]|uniref:hypothetical protein n=1 Tax=Furfurilactobacillus rossiae TaxID=231049 RepID=UPI0015C06BDE|nr:hypothetical protein [Furfurilactobacillus rossiae]QLE63992.1 phage protein [Furfurilactobacillus rossiae]
MTKNTLGDLNNHLFAELERLDDEDLKGEDLSNEIERAKAISDVAGKAISNADLVLKAKVSFDDRMNADSKMPKMLEDNNG